jgi:hypothetical protein
MADELAGKLAVVAASIAMGERAASKGQAERFGTRFERPSAQPGRPGRDGQGPRPSADEARSWRGYHPLAAGQQQSRQLDTRGRPHSRQHLEGLDKVTPWHIGMMFLASMIFWAAVFGAYLAHELYFK